MAAWGTRLRQVREGVMLHYDASASDSGAVYWMTQDPACKVSYQWLVLDDGAAVRVAPDSARAYHAGFCRPSAALRAAGLAYTDANSAFFGIAVAATDGDRVTEAQKGTVLRLTLDYFKVHKWPLQESWRVVGHEEECWPRGRKPDPTGSDASRPVLSVEEIRGYLANALGGGVIPS